MRLSRLFLIFFLISGTSGLIYEVLWVRMLSLVFGSTTFAISTVLVAFMAGLALGSFILSRYVDRLKKPILLYSALELGIGCYALLIPLLLDVLTPAYRLLWKEFHLSFYSLSFFRFLLAGAVLLIPTTLMGGTLPALSKFYGRRKDSIGFSIGLLYALNTLGAVLGALVAGLVLLPREGMRATNLVAVSLNLAIGLSAMAIALRARAEEQPLVSVEAPAKAKKFIATLRGPEPRIPHIAIIAVLVTFGLSGFVAMTYEVAWSRLLTLILGSSTYAFTTMLATFLVGLALGSLLMSRFADRISDPVLALARVQIGIGVAALLGQLLFNELPYFFLVLFSKFSRSGNVLLAIQFVLSALVMLLPTLLLGAVFPLVVRVYTYNVEKVGRLVGTAYAVNTFGTVLGAFASGFILLPRLGIQRSVTLGLTTNLCIGLALLLIPTNGHKRMGFRFASSIGLAFLIPVSIYYAPAWNPLLMSSGVYKDAPLYLDLYRSPADALSRITEQYKQLFYKEGVTATVAVVERPSLEATRHLTLSIDGKVDASTAADMSTQVLSAHLPLLLTPNPKRIMVVGWASGITVGSVTLYPVDEIVAVEIEPAVIPASAFFKEFNREPLKDPRVKLIIDDARNYFLVSEEKYDVIISEPSNPWMSGPAKLFTREFFLLGKKRLQPNGIFAQWLQLYGMEPENLKALVRTFHSVFPYVHIFQTAEADLILLGSEHDRKLDYRLIKSRISDAKVLADLKRVKVADALDLLTRWRLGSREVATYAGEGLLNTDDNALIEFAAPKSIYTDTIAQNIEQIRKAAVGIASYLTNVGSSDDERAAVYLDLAWRFFLSGERDQARLLVETSLATDKSADGYWLAGKLSLERGDESAALESWRKALDRDSFHVLTRLSLARYYQSWADFQTAEKHFSPLLERHSVNPLVRYLHGINLYHLGRFRDAIVELEAALSLGLNKEPEDGGFPLAVVHESFRLGGLEKTEIAHYYLSLAYLQLKDEVTAAQHMEIFLDELETWRMELEQDPTRFTRFKLIEDFKVHQARGIYLEEEMKLAQLIEQHVAAFLTRYSQGVTLYLLGYYQEAAVELEEALRTLQRRSGSALTHYFLGLSYKKTGEYGLAADHLEHFLKRLGPEQRDGPRAIEASRNLEEIRAVLNRGVRS